MLVHGPLSYPDALGVLATGLLTGGAALRIWRWHTQYGASNAGVLIPAIFALIALAAIWSGAWRQLGDTPITAIGVAAALELCGMGAVWVMEAVRCSVAPGADRSDGCARVHPPGLSVVCYRQRIAQPKSRPVENSHGL